MDLLIFYHKLNLIQTLPYSTEIKAWAMSISILHSTANIQTFISSIYSVLEESLEWFKSCMNFVWLGHNERHTARIHKHPICHPHTNSEYKQSASKCWAADNQQLCLYAQHESYTHTNCELWIVHGEGARSTHSFYPHSNRRVRTCIDGKTVVQNRPTYSRIRINLRCFTMR